ncbi:hypothetical protein CVT24_006539, partial [Panaeolus cyanescens]
MPHPALLRPPNSNIILGPPKHRHSAPSGPWPFIDIDDDVDASRLQNDDEHHAFVKSPCGHEQFLHLIPNDTALGDEEWDDVEDENYASMSGGGGHERMGSISSIGSATSSTSGSSPHASPPQRRPTRRPTIFTYRQQPSQSMNQVLAGASIHVPMVSEDPVSYTSSDMQHPALSRRPGSPASVASSPGSLRVPSPTLSVSEYHANYYPPGYGAFLERQQREKQSAAAASNNNNEEDEDAHDAEGDVEGEGGEKTKMHTRSESLDVASDSVTLHVSAPSSSPSPPPLFSSPSPPPPPPRPTYDPTRSMSLDTVMSGITVGGGMGTEDDDAIIPCWCKYPQSLFPNWTKVQQQASGLGAVIAREPEKESEGAGVWILDVVGSTSAVGGGGGSRHVRSGSAGSEKGKEREMFKSSLGGLGVPESSHNMMSSPFLASSASRAPTLPIITPTPAPAPASPISPVNSNPPPSDPDEIQEVSFVNKKRVMCIYRNTLDSSWETFLTPRDENVKTRVLFVDDLSGPILQMLGTHYRIEPFFFTSTLGRIPASFQSHVVPGKSDHLTITLPFIRSVKCSDEAIQDQYTANGRDQHLVIDTEAPLPLSSSNNLLVSDMLSLHIIRSPRTNTIISLQAPPSHPHLQGHNKHPTTGAPTLHSRVFATGRSVYWNHILKASRDPTFLFLSFLWYALYAWDEAFEHLFAHITSLESEVMGMTDMRLTQELHVVRAHLLHYESMLEGFRKAVVFVLRSPNQTLIATGTEEEEEIRRDWEEQEYVVNVGYQKEEEGEGREQGHAQGQGQGKEEEVQPWLKGESVVGGTQGMSTLSHGGVDVISEEPEAEEAEDVVSPYQQQRQRRESPSTPTKLSGMTRLRAQSASALARPVGLQSQSQAQRASAVGGSGSGTASNRPRAHSQATGAPPASPSAKHKVPTMMTPPSPNSPGKYSSFGSAVRPGSPTMIPPMHSPTRSATQSTTGSHAYGHGVPPHRSNTRTSSLSSIAHPEIVRQRQEAEARHRKVSRAMMRKECAKLLQEIERLEKARNMQNKRLKNVMDLGFSMVNIEDSKRMHELTKAALRDSAAMKQISYLTMVFLPSSFVAAAFGMNVIEINPDGSAARLWQYVAVSVPLTIITVWIIIALQIEMHQPKFKTRYRHADDTSKSKSKHRSKGRNRDSGAGKKATGDTDSAGGDAFHYPPAPANGASPPFLTVNGGGAMPHSDNDTELGSTSAYDDSDSHEYGTTDEDSNSDTDSDTDDDDMPEYGEYYASEGVAS